MTLNEYRDILAIINQIKNEAKRVELVEELISTNFKNLVVEKALKIIELEDKKLREIAIKRRKNSTKSKKVQKF